MPALGKKHPSEAQYFEIWFNKPFKHIWMHRIFSTAWIIHCGSSTVSYTREIILTVNVLLFLFPSVQTLWAKERLNCSSSENNWEEESHRAADGNSWSGTEWWTVHRGKENVILWVCQGRGGQHNFLLVEYSHSAVASLSCWTCSPGVLWPSLATRLP